MNVILLHSDHRHVAATLQAGKYKNTNKITICPYHCTVCTENYLEQFPVVYYAD